MPTAPVVLSPTADFSYSSTTGAVPLVVVFDASASSSPNGSISSYSWDYGDGTTGTGAITDHLYDVAGAYSITLTVLDFAGKTATKALTLIVTDQILPVASFTYSIDTSGALITTVDGSLSSSQSGSIVTYLWDWGDSSPASTGVISSHTYLAPGSYSVTLHVADNLGNTNTITQIITVPLPALP